MSNLGKDQYVYLGHAYGTFTPEDGNPVNYSKIFAFAPAEGNPNSGYNASGFKAEALKTSSPEVAAGMKPGYVFEPCFDRYGRVKEIRCSGEMFKIG